MRTIQQAAFEILKERGRPLDSRSIAQIALDAGTVSSAARDPVASLAQTIEKNIRDQVNNRPKLGFVSNGRRRLIGLPEHGAASGGQAAERAAPGERHGTYKSLTVRVPSDLLRKVRLIAHAELAPSFEETVVLLLESGVESLAPVAKQELERQLEGLHSKRGA